jgi:indole-3-glycerol phosphate synthase
MSGDFLALMARSSRERVLQARAKCSEAQLRVRCADAAPAPPLRLGGHFDLIAEVKLRSPAVGQLRDSGDDIAVRVADYASAGAAVISVLTEPSRFDGALEHVTRAAAALHGHIPVMRKDFLTDTYQLYEARLAGAGGVLLILRMLEQAQLQRLIECAAALGLFTLLEAFDAEDLQLAATLVERYAGSASLMVGVNCRDLVSLQVVPGRLERLAPLLPRAVPRVAESGVAAPADAARLAQLGYDVALVGSALMQAADPLALASAMLQQGRAARHAADSARRTER